ncbi:MAG: type II toxin-antitoxin system RelE/ParE family toxin [Paludisphaera borealis]|uniref:type II toxin-antitoxin system RelE/ParE family toxin n=1 Tax=Paludisphaera borealis TaxID=1387353 RepID=UPI00284345F8|nr:type II toxin-antitoxin system RelE/ParE family toxin [Paludisphaera borealis]MDR3618572.1 type II toxin-antitoxin system RelE/ParE family toxin [Paludisphaera borealis]
MKYRVVVTARARADAVEAFRWMFERSPDAAARWYVGLEKAIAALAETPMRHPVAEEESEHLGIPLRQMLYGRRRGVHRILFSIEHDVVTLHFIRHGAQGPIEH